MSPTNERARVKWRKNQQGFLFSLLRTVFGWMLIPFIFLTDFIDWLMKVHQCMCTVKDRCLNYGWWCREVSPLGVWAFAYAADLIIIPFISNNFWSGNTTALFNPFALHKSKFVLVWSVFWRLFLYFLNLPTLTVVIITTRHASYLFTKTSSCRGHSNGLLNKFVSLEFTKNGYHIFLFAIEWQLWLLPQFRPKTIYTCLELVMFWVISQAEFKFLSNANFADRLVIWKCHHFIQTPVN